MDETTNLPQWLFEIRYLVLSFRYLVRHNARLGYFPGPEVRGSIGRQFKEDLGCHADRDADCRICPENRRQNCVYHHFFEHGGHRRQRFALRLDPAWRSLEPRFQKGDYFGFDLVLAGKQTGWAPQILDILGRTRLRLGKQGISPQLVDSGWRDEKGSFISARHSSVLPPAPGFLLTFSRNRAPANSVILHFLTPAEITLKHGSILRNPEDLSFRLLLVRIMQRLRGLAGADPERLPPAPSDRRSEDRLLAAASAVTHSPGRAHWQKVTLRQTGKRRCGGLAGSINYRGDLTAFIPFFEAARVFNLGKSPALGLGQINFEQDFR